MHEALQAQRDELGLGLGLLQNLVVEVPEQRLAVPLQAVRGSPVHAAGDDGAGLVVDVLAALHHAGADERGEGFYLGGHLHGLALAGAVGELQRVQERAGVWREHGAGAAELDGHVAVLVCGVGDDDLVVWVGQPRVADLALGAEALAAARLAAVDAHGAVQLLAVEQHQVQRVAVLAVVAAALLAQLQCCEGALDGDLVGEHEAGDVHVVAA